MQFPVSWIITSKGVTWAHNFPVQARLVLCLVYFALGRYSVKIDLISKWMNKWVYGWVVKCYFWEDRINMI